MGEHESLTTETDGDSLVEDRGNGAWRKDRTKALGDAEGRMNLTRDGSYLGG